MFFEETKVFPSDGHSNYRIPSLIVTNNGTVLAFCTNRIGSLKDHADEVALVYAVKKPNKPWSDVIELAHLPGWSCNIGSAVYDDIAEKAIIFFTRNPVTQDEFGSYTTAELEVLQQRRLKAIQLAADNGIFSGSRRFVSEDNGEHFREEAHVVIPERQIHWDGSAHSVGGSTHGSAHGIRLKHGPHAGRLLCPSRTQIGQYNDWEKIKECVYNNSIYSDDHGKTWQASSCVQVGTGEGTLIERGDGSILYNSRAYFRDGKRYLATSRDGGKSYDHFITDPHLTETPHSGCNASFLRIELGDQINRSYLPSKVTDITVFCNPRAETRRRMTASISFDSGATYPQSKVIYDGPAAYSSLDFDKNTGHFYLLYERGGIEDNNPYAEGLYVAEFDLEWLLDSK